MTDFSADKLRELHKAATQGDLTTAERHIKCETVECPACQGDGELDAADYCNFDGVALGVQFYGIGGHFDAHEALWRYLVQSLPAILAMAEERERSEKHRNDLADRITDQSITVGALKADNARMREALERIAGMTDVECDFDAFDARKDAVAALAFGEEKAS